MENAAKFSNYYPLNILIAENNPVAQATTKGILTELGYQPEEATNGQEVLNMTSRKAYDVILMDIHMPEVEGMLGDWLSAGQARRPLIIAMTNKTKLGFRQVCLQVEMDHSINKPVDPKELSLQLKACSILAGNCRIRANK